MIYEGNCRLGDLFESRREKGREGLPLLSVTMNDGLVHRDDLDRKQDSSLSSAEHLLVKPGDIAYNMMRMWQGAFGLADCEGLVSPAYVVLKPKSSVNSEFAAHLLRTPRLRYLLWAYSYGMTEDRLRLYFQDFSTIPAYVPNLQSQDNICKIIGLWDRAISINRQLIANSETQFKAIAAELTNSKKSKKTWETATLGDLGQPYGGLSGKIGSDFGEGSKYIPYNNIFKNHRIDMKDLGFVRVGKNERQNRVKLGDIFFTVSSETPNDVGMASVLLDDSEDLFLNSFCFGFRLFNFEKLLPEYAAHMLRAPLIRSQLAKLAQGSTRFNISQSRVLKLKIEIPPLLDQRKIIDTLNSATLSISGLISNLQKQQAEKIALVANLITSGPPLELRR